MAGAKHFKKTRKNKRGDFKKCGSEKYRRACVDGKVGYLSDWFEAHHILPCESFNLKLIRDSELKKYVINCMWVTPWDINDKINMMGLPHLKAYILAAHVRRERRDKSENDKNIVKWYGKVTKIKDRRLVGQDFSPPENHPVHNPVSWGHSEFTKEVEAELKTRVWDTLNANKEKHALDPESIKEKLNQLIQVFHNELEIRGRRNGGTEANWPKRNHKENPDWFIPFSMAWKPRRPY